MRFRIIDLGAKNDLREGSYMLTWQEKNLCFKELVQVNKFCVTDVGSED